LAQEGAITPHGSVNDRMSGQNTSQWVTNPTLVFAQENNTEGTLGQSSESKNDGNNK
jgi:hypothetical protein